MKKTIITAAATSLALLASGCGNTASARDIRACKLLRHDLAATRLNPLHLEMDAAIATSPHLRKAIQVIAEGLAFTGTPYSATGYQGMNAGMKAAHAICAQDGVPRA